METSQIYQIKLILFLNIFLESAPQCNPTYVDQIGLELKDIDLFLPPKF